ncbi:hypothetical protein QP157_03450 [Sphingomonas sp. LR61]|uniref:hypothetical protein n=1 Tax=Sphingomonas sp. LR61 TaxID=3050234 RepID=UPI002FE2D191
MWWWIGTGLVLAVLLVLWFVVHRYTNFGSRAAKFEGTDPEVAEALRQAEADIAPGAHVLLTLSRVSEPTAVR